MFKSVILACVVSLFFTGCASIPMVEKSISDEAKLFSKPTEDKSGIYIYRDSAFGASLKKDIWVDGKCIGESAPKVFFYTEVDGDKEHIISTESEFSPNSISIYTKKNTNYFVRQYIKIGAFVGGANLEVIEPSKGQLAIQSLKMAVPGTCSK